MCLVLFPLVLLARREKYGMLESWRRVTGGSVEGEREQFQEQNNGCYGDADDAEKKSGASLNLAEFLFPPLSSSPSYVFSAREMRFCHGLETPSREEK